MHLMRNIQILTREGRLQKFEDKMYRLSGEAKRVCNQGLEVRASGHFCLGPVILIIIIIIAISGEVSPW